MTCRLAEEKRALIASCRICDSAKPPTRKMYLTGCAATRRATCVQIESRTGLKKPRTVSAGKTTVERPRILRAALWTRLYVSTRSLSFISLTRTSSTDAMLRARGASELSVASCRGQGARGRLRRWQRLPRALLMLGCAARTLTFSQASSMSIQYGDAL